MAKKKYIGELLVEAGIISAQQLENALDYQKRQFEKKQIGDILVELEYITETELHEALEFQLGIPYANLDQITIPEELASKVPDSIARMNKLVPVKISNNRLYIAMADPFDLQAIEDVQTISKMNVSVLFSKEQAIMQAVEELYGNINAEKAIADFKRENNLVDAAIELENIEDEEIGNAPIVRLVNSILEQAINDGASDIHIEPGEREVRVRMRVDGLLSQILKVPRKAHSAILTRVKIMGNINIAEKRIPQDGRAEMNIAGHDVDIRISTLPTVFGEKAVLRLLDRQSFLKPKSALGFTPENEKKFEALLKNPHGLLLVTGPTGSGKSTTLYTMLSELNKEQDNIITVEDPVEYMIKGLNQVNVNVKAGLGFANALRSILRQDPDIIMVGEIRDQETVDIAIRAAITGHLVLSTLHTNSASGTIARLLEMGVEPYMLSASLVGVISQRLVRKICPSCKTKHDPSPEELKALGLEKDYSFGDYYTGKGCQNCNNSGYKGRIAVHEILVVDPKVRSLIPQEDASSKILEYTRSNGIKGIKDECIILLQEGVISIKEAISVAFTQD